ncbi:unnamed protein product, partial [Staurois parvus]
MPVSAAYQCCQSVPPISASQCRLSVCMSAAYQLPISDACQCPSVPPTSAHQCHLSVPPHQCPSVQPISAHHYSLISAHQ